MGQVPLSAGRKKTEKRVVGYADVDDDLLLVLSEYNWTVSDEGYPVTQCKRNGKWTCVRLHHMVWEYKKGDRPIWPQRIDHIDRNKWNSRADNLREVSPSMNNANRENTVFLEKGKWVATIMKDRKPYYLGAFKTKQEALEVRAKKKKELYPEV